MVSVQLVHNNAKRKSAEPRKSSCKRYLSIAFRACVQHKSLVMLSYNNTRGFIFLVRSNKTMP